MISVKKLSTGYYRVRGDGPCEWAQPPHWPCSEETLREHAFPEASERFIAAAIAEALRAEPEPEPGFWRCKCGTEVPEVWADCDRCGAPHPYAHGGPDGE